MDSNSPRFGSGPEQAERLERLRAIVRERSYREGDFTLASGKKSSFYVDLKNTTLDPEGASLIGELATQVLGSIEPSIRAVGGLTLGADPIATAVSIKSFEGGHNWPAFIVRKEPKAHGTSRYVEGIENLSKGWNVAVLEDVVTTGGSSLKAVDRLKQDGLSPTVVLTIVDRGEGAKEAIESQGLRFESLLTLDEIRR